MSRATITIPYIINDVYQMIMAPWKGPYKLEVLRFKLSVSQSIYLWNWVSPITQMGFRIATNQCWLCLHFFNFWIAVSALMTCSRKPTIIIKTRCVEDRQLVFLLYRSLDQKEQLPNLMQELSCIT